MNATAIAEVFDLVRTLRGGQGNGLELGGTSYEYELMAQ